jgi:dodecin
MMLLESLTLFISVRRISACAWNPLGNTRRQIDCSSMRALLLHYLIAAYADPPIKDESFCFQGGFMNEHIYKQIELTGTSKTSMEDAVQNAISKASKTLHNLHWFQVVESRGYIENNKIDYWQVTIKLGFRLDD